MRQAVGGARRASRSATLAAAFVLAGAGTAAAQAPGGFTGGDLVVPAVTLIVGIAVGGIVAYLYSGTVRRAQIGNGQDSKTLHATMEIGFVIGGFAVLGALALAVACLGLPASQGSFAAMLGVDLLVGGAAAALGGLLGFIFGVPRTVDGVRKPGDPEGAPGVTLGANTNLERVSDWLTTLLIGATLVQIKDVPGWIAALSEFLVTPEGLTNGKLIPFVCVYFFVLAFLGVYLVTRLYLTAALKEALQFVSVAGGVSAVALVGERMRTALAEGTTAGFRTALDLFTAWPLSEAERRDPALNAEASRLLGRYLTSGEADDAGVRRAQLASSVANAAADPAHKASLLQAMRMKRLTSGDAATDADLLALLE